MPTVTVREVENINYPLNKSLVNQTNHMNEKWQILNKYNKALKFEHHH